MIGIVIVAHGGLAPEYLRAIEHVVGAQTGILAISMEGDDDRTAKQAEVCAAADAVDTGDGVLIVTDLFWRFAVEPVLEGMSAGEPAHSLRGQPAYADQADQEPASAGARGRTRRAGRGAQIHQQP